MSIIGSLPFTFVNGTVADGTQVNADLAAIVTSVNANAQPLITGFSGTGNYVLATGATMSGATIDGAFTGGLTGNADTATTAGYATTAGSATTAGYATNAGNASTVTTNANLTGPITSIGNATAIVDSVYLPGSPTTTTQNPADNSTKIATTAFVAAAVSGGGGSFFHRVTVTGITANGAIITLPANALPCFVEIYVHGFYGMYAAPGHNGWFNFQGSAATNNKITISNLVYQDSSIIFNQSFSPLFGGVGTWLTVNTPTTLTLTIDSNGTWNLADSAGNISTTATVDVSVYYVLT